MNHVLPEKMMKCGSLDKDEIEENRISPGEPFSMPSPDHAPDENATPINFVQTLLLRLLFVGYFAYLNLLLLTPDPFRMVGSSQRFAHFLEALEPLAHGISFIVLTILALFAGRPLPRWTLLLGLVGYGALTEIMQKFVPHRTPEWKDWFQDILGVVIGFCIVWGLAKGWKAMRKPKNATCSETVG
jgi:VanZ family protein